MLFILICLMKKTQYGLPLDRNFDGLYVCWLLQCGSTTKCAANCNNSRTTKTTPLSSTKLPATKRQQPQINLQFEFEQHHEHEHKEHKENR